MTEALGYTWDKSAVSHARGLEFIHADPSDVFEQAIAYFLFAALQQFYFDGNKRTAR